MTLRVFHILLAFMLLAMGGWRPLAAQEATPPYAVTVPVPDTSDAVRTAAFSNGLSQVLIRVAGGQDLRDKPGYADALKNAAGIVQQYQYNRADGAAPGLSLQMSFDPAAVQRLMAGMDVASAGVKPPVLAIVQGADGQPLQAADLTALKEAAAAHDYAVIVADPGTTPDFDALRQADPAALSKLAQQYKTGLILLGQLATTSANWTLVSGGQAQSWKANGASEDALLGAAGNDLSSRLGKQLNVIGSGISNGKLWVSHVRSAMDYANVLALLRANPAVQAASTVAAQGDGMLFAVQANLPLDTLAANLAASGRFSQATSHAGADVALQWEH